MLTSILHAALIFCFKIYAFTVACEFFRICGVTLVAVDFLFVFRSAVLVNLMAFLYYFKKVTAKKEMILKEEV